MDPEPHDLDREPNFHNAFGFDDPMGGPSNRLLRADLRTPRSRRALIGLLFVVSVFVVVPVVAMLLAGT
jgi:hypothetical protein